MTQTALVTGAAQGIGLQIASQLLAAGYRVVVSDRDGEAAQKAAGELDPEGNSTLALTLDVAEAGSFDTALDQILSHWGELHVLVNNAAVTRAQAVMDILPEEFNEVVNINLGGVFAGCQAIGRYFRSRRYGRIINMASLAGQNGGTATGAHYAASKGGIVTLTKVFAKELAADGVTVNAVAPGPVDSPMVRGLIPADRLDGFIQAIPAGTLGSAAFIGDMVVQLARPEASFVTGAVWDVNGGLYMR